MKVFNKLQNLKNTSLALGFFDGVHIGHQDVINSALNQDGITTIITFKQHPKSIIKKESTKYISTMDDRRQYFESMGVEYLFEIDFTDELAELTAEDYLKNIIIDNFKPISISTGENHTFGKNRSGNSELLNNLQNKYDYKYYKINSKKINDTVISSSLIKSNIKIGNIEIVNLMLGRKFQISGEIIHGEHIATSIGFPTANIKYPDNIEELPYGVYHTEVFGNNAITNYGIKPTFNIHEPIVETHIQNYNENIYGKKIKINFIKKIRDEIAFKTVDELKIQIKKDLEKCSKL